MARKLFAFLTATVQGRAVQVVFFKGTPLFTDDGGERLGVRIRRSTEDAFTFNDDYAEYFDGLGHEHAEVIFDGELEAADGRRFCFVDDTVEAGRTYAYWVSSGRGDPPTGPVGVRVRDPRVWWSEQELDRRLDALAAGRPDLVQGDVAGRTAQGRPLRKLVVGGTDKSIALIGAIHPGEAGPELIVGALERLAARDADLLRRVGVVAIPSLGVDERQRLAEGHPGYIRKNHNHVDVNRNFPARWDVVEHTYGLNTADPLGMTYRGRAPGSEPETKAVMRLVAEFRPAAVFSFHCLASICGPTFLTSRYAVDDTEFNVRAQAIADDYNRGFYGRPGDVVLRHACAAGSMPTWLHDEYGIPGFDLEWDGRAESKVSHHDQASPELVEEYQERHYGAVRQLLLKMVDG